MKKTSKYIANILLAYSLSTVPAELKAQDVQKTQVEMEQNTVSVSVSGSTIHIKNADHMVLEIFSITGEKVYTTRIDSQSKNIDLDNLSRGCYIVRIGKYTRKVYFK